MDVKTEMQLRKLTSSLNVIRILDAQLPIQTMVAFLVIAANEGLPINQVAAKAGLEQSSASRNVSVLTNLRYDKRPGLSLVEYRQDYMNLTIKKLYLTKKGEGIVKQIITSMKQKEE